MKKIGPVKVNERSRKYVYPGGNVIELEGVLEIIISSSGNHRIRTRDKKLHIIAPGWLHIEIDSPSGRWAF